MTKISKDTASTSSNKKLLFSKSLEILHSIDKEISILSNILSLLYWDSAVLLPQKAVQQRAEQISLLTLQIHDKLTSKELNSCIVHLSEPENLKKLDSVSKVIVERYAWIINRIKKIPKSHVEEFTKLVAVSQHKWEEAKKKSDFKIFKPYLEKIVKMKIAETRYIDSKKNPYNVLLEEYERGMTVEKIDKIFAHLRDELIKILNNIKKSKLYKKNLANKNKKNSSKNILQKDFPEEIQKIVVTDIATRILEDNKRFSISKSIHPFSTTISPDDMRITTAFRSHPFFSFSSTTHESGHSFYESNFSQKLRGTILFNAPSCGLHESQSRIWENQICRGKAFWKGYYKYYQGMFPSLKNVKFEDFYAAINEVSPSLIRIEADELTYCLHIIIRYEIEKMLLNGALKVSDLPKTWNAKYKEYLGIVPKNDAEGVLQDTHWSGGSLGYFPTYALGTLYSAMIYSEIKNRHPKLESELEKLDFSSVKFWLKENIHKHGFMMLTPQIIQNACKKDITADDFLDYLRDKFYKIYAVNK